MASLGYPCKFQRVSRLGSVTARHSSSGRQPNFAASNRGRHLYSTGRPSRWAFAHICSFINICFKPLFQKMRDADSCFLISQERDNLVVTLTFFGVRSTVRNPKHKQISSSIIDSLQLTDKTVYVFRGVITRSQKIGWTMWNRAESHDGGVQGERQCPIPHKSGVGGGAVLINVFRKK